MEALSKIGSASLALRAASFVASFIVSAAVLASVAALFDRASREPVLRDSPQARAVLARCAGREGREARRACVQQVIAKAAERDAGVSRVAAGASGVAVRDEREPR